VVDFTGGGKPGGVDGSAGVIVLWIVSERSGHYCRGGGWVERGGDACVAHRPLLLTRWVLTREQAGDASVPSPALPNSRPYRMARLFLFLYYLSQIFRGIHAYKRAQLRVNLP